MDMLLRLIIENEEETNMRAVILGAGVSGCAIANELDKKGIETVVIEKNGFLGGGCHTFFYGGHPYTEGPLYQFCCKAKNISINIGFL